MAAQTPDQHLSPSQRLMAMIGKPVPPAPTELEQADFQRWLDDGDQRLADWLRQRRALT